MYNTIDHWSEPDGLYVSYFLLGHLKGPTASVRRVPGTWSK
jgi:hypothetical protein